MFFFFELLNSARSVKNINFLGATPRLFFLVEWAPNSANLQALKNCYSEVFEMNLNSLAGRKMNKS